MTTTAPIEAEPVVDPMKRDLTKLMAFTRKDQRPSLRPLAEEYVYSVGTSPDKATVVVKFCRRYGLEQGMRTVVLTRATETDYEVIVDSFQKGELRPPSGTGTVEYHSIFEVVPAKDKPQVVPASLPEFGPALPPLYGPAVPLAKVNPWPAELLGVAVYGPRDDKPEGWYLGHHYDKAEAFVGPFTLASMEAWMQARAAIVGQAKPLAFGERVLWAECSLPKPKRVLFQ